MGPWAHSIDAKRLANLNKKLKEVADECNSIIMEIFETYVQNGDRSDRVINGIMNRGTRSDGKSDFEVLAAQIKKYKASECGAIQYENVQFATNSINDMLDFFSKVFEEEKQI